MAMSTIKARQPEFIPPMKAMLVKTLPEGPEWIYEVKWDGYRALASKHGNNIQLLSLNCKSLASDFPTVVADVRAINANTALLDGEVVAINAQGQPSFQVLQHRSSLGRGWHIVYYAFDLLNLEGEDLRHLPLERRKERLETLVEGTRVRYSGPLPGSPAEIVPVLKDAGLEGVVAKRRDSTYAAGTRSTVWQKFKLSLSQEFVIGGYNPEGKKFSSLLVGYYDSGGRLMFAGKVRQGFNPASRLTLMKILKPLATETCPFANLPISKRSHFGEGITEEDMEKLQWLNPKLVAQVSFTEWTNGRLFRHATFLNLRDDKEPKEVVKERP